MHAAIHNCILRAKNRGRAIIVAADHYSARKGELVMHDRKGGFFSIYCQVLGTLYVANILKCSLKLHFTQAPYYTPSLSPVGWWDHYFETSVYNPDYKTRKTSIPLLAIKKNGCFVNLGMNLERSLAHKLTLQLKLKNEVKNEIENFAHAYFDNKFIIGVHYRGTDKVEGRKKETDRVAYEAVISALSQLAPHTFFFIATDEQAFLDAMEIAFSGRIIQRNQYRSENGTPLHDIPKTAENLGYSRGLDALIDAQLLARTNGIIRTDSNVSLVSGFFNPHIPLINLSKITSCNNKTWSRVISSALPSIH